MSIDDEPLPRSPTTTLGCPECGEAIAVPITVTLAMGADGQLLDCTPDLTDVWAHAWTHSHAG